MFEAQKDLDLPQGALAVRLVLKGADLLDGHTDFVVAVIGRTEALQKKMTLWFKQKLRGVLNNINLTDNCCFLSVV